MNRQNRALKPNAQGFDEVKITTVPRYKSSGLSGDEWRISGLCQLLRKGNVIHEFYMSNVENCVKALPAQVMTAQDEGKFFFGGEGDYCDQEGCSDTATVVYKMKKKWCNNGYHEPETYKDEEAPTRRFCERHSKRGDCGMEDADDNYELLGGNVVEPEEQDVKPAIFGGMVKVENIEEAPELIREKIKEVRDSLNSKTS